MENTSGQGKQAVIPDGVKRWNWGAFVFSWIWGLFNHTFIALLALIPYVTVIVVVVLGLKGNEWAWRNKKWESVDQFHAAQRKWAVAAAIVWGIILLAVIAAVALPFLIGPSEAPAPAAPVQA